MENKSKKLQEIKSYIDLALGNICVALNKIVEILEENNKNGEPMQQIENHENCVMPNTKWIKKGKECEVIVSAVYLEGDEIIVSSNNETECFEDELSDFLGLFRRKL